MNKVRSAKKTSTFDGKREKNKYFMKIFKNKMPRKKDLKLSYTK